MIKITIHCFNCAVKIYANNSSELLAKVSRNSTANVFAEYGDTLYFRCGIAKTSTAIDNNVTDIMLQVDSKGSLLAFPTNKDNIEETKKTIDTNLKRIDRNSKKGIIVIFSILAILIMAGFYHDYSVKKNWERMNQNRYMYYPTDKGSQLVPYMDNSSGMNDNYESTQEANDVCPNCYGSGDCPDCAGRGQKHSQYYYDGSYVHDCTTCNGRGKCNVCLGSGKRY